MLTKTCFDRCMNTLLIFGDIPVDKEKNKLFYNLMKNDFEDREFSIISENICKTETLYGKYPSPKMFYDRKSKDKSNTVMILEGQFYLDDTMPEYKDYLIGVSDEEQERIWKWIYENKYGEEVSKDWIIDRIIQFRKPKETKWIEDNGLHLVNVIKKIEG